jgi:membrane-associated phospholipid phosphatase
MNSTKELFYDWMGGNEVIFLGINSIHNAYYDKFMQTVSDIGDHEHFPIYFIAIFAFAVFSILWKVIRGKHGKWQSTGIWFGVLSMLILGYATTGLATKELKDYFSYPRPYVALAATGEVYKLEATEPKDDFRSFPSGHMTFTTFMVIALSPVLSPLLTWCGFWLILLMGWSRMALGMHFPADIIGGVLIIAPIIMILRWAVYTSLRKLFGIRC